MRTELLGQACGGVESSGINLARGVNSSLLHYDGKVHLDRLVYRDAENWAPLRGVDEKIPVDD